VHAARPLGVIRSVPAINEFDLTSEIMRSRIARSWQQADAVCSPDSSPTDRTGDCEMVRVVISPRPSLR